MKKQLIGAIALITMSVAASATTSSIEGITVSDSENCSDGYVIKSEREGISKVVTYDSCLNTGMVVSDGSESVEGAVDLSETVNIGGTDYYFPAGYTTPTVELGGTCETGKTEGYCQSRELTELGEGYLNVVEASGRLYLFDNQLTNVDGLSNLTSVGDRLYLHDNQLTNVDGLSNLTSVGSYLYLYNNQLTNVDGLSSLTSVGDYLSLYDNRLTNVDGLSNLTSVGSGLYLHYNQLTNVDGLSNLTSAGSYLYLYSNPDLSDLSGLNNLTSVGNQLRLDDREYEVKLDADSYLCVNFDTKVTGDIGNPLTKSNVCND